MVRIVLAGLLQAALASTALAQSNNEVTIAVLNDQSSSFSALGGSEVVKAVELAIKDFGGKVLGKDIKLISADHQNKPEVGLAIARQWLDEGEVDVIVDVANSAVAIGVNQLLGEKKKVGLFVSPMTDKTTEAECNGYVVAWAFDAYSTVGTTIKGLLAAGSSDFFVLSPDYEAGKVMEESSVKAIEAAGANVKGSVRSALGTTDFSSLLLQAQASGAKVLLINLSGSDLVNAMKQVQEFGLIDAGMKVAVTYMFQSDVRSIGVEAAQGVQFAAPWVWGQDEESRVWGRRMMEITGNAPGWIAAGNYSAVTKYLHAVEKAGTDEPDAVLKQLRDIDLNDFFVKNGELRPNGRLVHDMHLVQVKKPDEVTEKHDFLKSVGTVHASKAFRPADATVCKLAQK